MTQTDSYPTFGIDGETVSINMNDKKYESVRVYMGDKQLTSDQFTYKDYIITIPNVTGNIIIMQEQFNYCGITEGMLLYADKNNSSNKKFGDLPSMGKDLVYDTDGSLKLGIDYATLQYNFDASVNIDDEYSIMYTIKGDTNQIGEPRIDWDFSENVTFPGMIVSLSNGYGNFLASGGYYKGYFSFYSYANNLTPNLNNTGKSKASFDISARNNKITNIIISAKRGEKTKVYMNGNLAMEFDSGDNKIDYSWITIGDLRNERQLKFQGNLYDLAFYDKMLNESQVQKNWECEQTKYNFN